jgi:hypothetical protein
MSSLISHNDQEIRLDVTALQEEIVYLRGRLAALESRASADRLPSEGLHSPRFLARSFAVFGHSLVAELLILIPVYIVIVFLLLAGGGY